ncbi:MAG TPA: ABC transporter ATP-binding protein [Stellaceae bacterium]|nr:ABC transporter ATP-binding protein [Stellaceae bacterium]
MSALLTVTNLAKAYRGVHAVEDASFCVERGSITGLIGPNGSGKSTTIDCISGFQRLDRGRVMLEGADITGLTPQKIARAGLVRTFQTVRVYDEFDLVANLMIAVEPFRSVGWHDALLRTGRYRAARKAAETHARELIELVGLTRLAAAPAAILSYGQKKLLALAAALMSRPRLVVLDEPVAGVNPTRINEVATILRKAKAAGTSFLIIEHNVEFITGLCDHVIVFDQGRKLTEGPPAEVHNDPRVLDAYLGIEEPAPHAVAEAS